MLSIQESTNSIKTVQAAVAGFLTDIRSGHSPATERTYGFILRHFCQYLSNLAASGQLPTELADNNFPISALQTDWAISFMRQLTAGQLRSEGKQDGTTPNPKPVPKSTIATYAAALMRFYRWCSVERLVIMPSDELERLAVRLRELRGKQKQTIIDKVPADEVIEALLEQARANLAATTANNETQSADISADGAVSPAHSKTAFAKNDALNQRLQALRNLALVETLKCTGARVSEITNLTRGDLDAANRRARVVGKGSKERWVYFSTAAWESVQSYLQTRTRLLGQAALAIDSTPPEAAEKTKAKKKPVRIKLGELAVQPVFARHDRGAGIKEVKPLTPRSVQRIMWSLIDAIEDEDVILYITPHKFRHWFATKMLSATGDLAVTQDLLGHANPATTRIYAQVSETKKQSSHRQVFE